MHGRCRQQDRHLSEGAGRAGQRCAVLCRAAVALDRLGDRGRRGDPDRAAGRARGDAHRRLDRGGRASRSAADPGGVPGGEFRLRCDAGPPRDSADHRARRVRGLARGFARSLPRTAPARRGLRVTDRSMQGWSETYRGTVPPWECDVTEHFTIAYYFDRLEEAERNLADSIGLRDLLRGAGFPRHLDVRFARELRAGSSFHVESAALSVDSGLRLGHRFVDSANGEVVTWIAERWDLAEAALSPTQQSAIA